MNELLQTPAPEFSCGRIDASAIEAHGDTLGQLYEMEFTQVESGNLSICVDFVASPSCVLYRETYGARTHALGALRGKKFAFAIPIRDPGTRWWGQERGRNLAPTSLSGELIDLFFAPGHAHFIVVIAQDRLIHAMEAARFPEATIHSVTAGRRHRMLEFHQESMDRAAEVFARLLARAPAGKLPGRVDRFDEAILDAALCLLDAPPTRQSREASGTHLFRRAVEMAEVLGGHPSLPALCARLNVRPRTLEAAFQNCAGISPYRFFTLRRLGRARQLLGRSCPRDCRVTDIALRLGFSELGRFAVAYRTLFGEKPSETLSRPPRTTVSFPF